jgi:Ca2+-binding RTX toxin-like protein
VIRRALIAAAAAPIAVAVALTVPASASAVVMTYEMRAVGNVVVLTDNAGVRNTVVLTKAEAVEGHPDVLFADTTEGITGDIKPPCRRISDQIGACPADVTVGADILLFGGNDSLSVAKDFGYRAFGLSSSLATTSAVSPFVQAQFGAGNDTGSDLSPYRDIWNGGPGKDRFNSGPGNDKVNGGAQNDVIDCGAGKHDVGIGGPGKRDLGIHCETVKH